MGVFGPPNARWAKIPRLALMSVRLSQFANLQSYRFIGAALSDLQLIAAKAPSGTALPDPGGVYLFLLSLWPEALVEDMTDHVFLMVEMGAAHAADRESRSRSSTIFKARGPRLIKRSLPIASARRRTRAMTIFLRKCTTGGPQVDRSVDKLMAFVSGR